MTKPNKSSLILASASPRRATLLDQLGLEYRIHTADIDESVRDGEAASAYVLRLASEKARKIAVMTTVDVFVLGADTAVVKNDQILGKPIDQNDARRMLTLLADSDHEVMTGVALVRGTQIETCLSITTVSFAALDADQVNAYWACGESQDKAGAYAIQGRAGAFVRRLEGSYSGVVGLPLYETSELFARFGVMLH